MSSQRRKNMSIGSKDLTEKNVKSVDFEANSSKMHIFLRIYNDIKTGGKLPIRNESHL